MKITKQIINKLKGKEGRKREEEIYAMVLNEIERGKKQKGLWAKAIAESEGNKSKIQSLYIQFRVQSIEDEMEILNEAEELRIEAAEAREQKKIEAAEAREQKKIEAAEAREQKKIEAAAAREEEEEQQHRKLWNEYAENLSHWQKSGHRYFTFATLFIYSIWVLHTVGISGGSQLWGKIYSALTYFSVDVGLLIFVSLFLINLCQPEGYSFSSRRYELDKRKNMYVYFDDPGRKWDGIKILLGIFLFHFIIDDNLVFDILKL
jgi:hypothetical protein